MLGSGYISTASAFRRTCADRRARHRRSRLVGRGRPGHVFGRSVAVRARRRHPRSSSRAARGCSICRCPITCSTATRRTSREALDFHRALDDRLAAPRRARRVVGLAADHGMNDKALPDGRPHVIFLEDDAQCPLWRRRGAGDLPDHRPVRAPSRRARLVRPGLRAKRAPTSRPVMAASASLPGIDAVLTAARRRRASNCRTTARPISS